MAGANGHNGHQQDLIVAVPDSLLGEIDRYMGASSPGPGWSLDNGTNLRIAIQRFREQARADRQSPQPAPVAAQSVPSMPGHNRNGDGDGNGNGDHDREAQP